MEYIGSLAEVDYSQGSFTMSAEEVRDHFSRMLSRYGGTLYGRSLSQQGEEDMFEIWAFLYRAGILNARVSDTSQPRGFRHLEPSEDSFLVSKSRWNELQQMLWEVNAVYRDYLITRQAEIGLRVGLPKKKEKGRRKRK